MEAAAIALHGVDESRRTINHRESRSMRNVNANMRARSGSLVPGDAIPFFCECGDPSCFGCIWMPVAVFDARVADESGWLVLEGHRASGLWYRSSPIPTRETVRARRARPAAVRATEDLAVPVGPARRHSRHRQAVVAAEAAA